MYTYRINGRFARKVFGIKISNEESSEYLFEIFLIAKPLVIQVSHADIWFAHKNKQIIIHTILLYF